MHIHSSPLLVSRSYGTTNTRFLLLCQTASIFWMVSCAMAASMSADVRRSAMKVTLCELYEHPEKYTGRTVEVRASVTRGMLLDDFSAQRPCAAYMRLQVDVSRGDDPASEMNRKRDGAWADICEKLRKGMNVVATFEGRFDPEFVWRNQKRIKIKTGAEGGYSKRDKSDGRIILYSVDDVVSHPKPHL
jgi:hypothetical protein